MAIRNPTLLKMTSRTVHHLLSRPKTTSAQYVASRARDPTFEKLMREYKNLLKVVSIQDLILASPTLSIPLPYLSRLSQKLHLNRGALSFIRKYPHIFALFYNTSTSQPFCKLTQTAFQISRQESAAADADKPMAVDRLARLLSISPSRSLPLRAIFKVWRELGLPDDFEDSVISQNSSIFSLTDAHEPNTHILKLVENPNPSASFSPAVENWRRRELGNENSRLDETEIRFGFRQEYPPGMKLSKDFRGRVKEWQRLPYMGPYEEMGIEVRRSKAEKKGLEKRAVGIVHEFLSLTVEKMVEVEKISHFRKWFGIDLNIRDLFLDHPAIFYLSTKGKRHTVFLREAYERGRLVDPNPIYDARRKLLELVVLGRRGVFTGGLESRRVGEREPEDELQEEGED
ncbi:protein ROOT PRIMORDIUM DEFECTIVE 1 [Magnolia sinica]|uniref:protein ROOT PRIMORDIUM DEFECTIVE 1 n=1 Tax=Magnolia sinica TaxID=86752 RepID=UPI00265B35A7|nr:protein ROOT PRIMORDIUM DEFECTIVE 1 [Magnolia sinica]